jgi:hypothetical protein
MAPEANTSKLIMSSKVFLIPATRSVQKGTLMKISALVLALLLIGISGSNHGQTKGPITGSEWLPQLD